LAPPDRAGRGARQHSEGARQNKPDKAAEGSPESRTVLSLGHYTSSPRTILSARVIGSSIAREGISAIGSAGARRGTLVGSDTRTPPRFTRDGVHSAGAAYLCEEHGL
jgi:hypothetical protein